MPTSPAATLPSPRSASFKNKENINLEKVPAYKQHESDAGSTQVQIARLSARIEQISTHLRINRKDFSSRRGLEAVLSQRKRLLKYLYRTDRCAPARRARCAERSHACCPRTGMRRRRLQLACCALSLCALCCSGQAQHPLRRSLPARAAQERRCRCRAAALR